MILLTEGIMGFLDDIGPLEFAIFLASYEEMAEEEKERLMIERDIFLPDDDLFGLENDMNFLE
ncbi:MAG: hypothetical protein HQK57_13020 [Deltaproteobacteria bacterium]|nr:hypothetical protein [Deltaproteobacteria bacterium]